MHIIITLAGHSRRFKKAGYDSPKFLIPVDGLSTIEHVVNMFSLTDDFHFVLNSEQKELYPALVSQLKLIVKKAHITVIEPHELGPAYSALQANNIPEDEPVIISYCDFIVRWNYIQFIRMVNGYDGAIPAFRGFHPASFGNTHYAYMRLNDKDEMLELREKSSFTSRRENEFASAGIYYFRHWKMYRYYAQKMLHEGFYGLKEGYVSLLFNLMVNDSLKVKVTEVENFICWGTPEDLEQYNFWSKYFSTASKQNGSLVNNKVRQVNLIPMGGKGSRFREYGYRTSKPLIQVRNKPMVISACESFPPAERWIFLPREEDLQKHPIEMALKKISHNTNIVPVKQDTSGQAATCLLAKSKLSINASLFIASCDYETKFSYEKWNTILQNELIDGAVWTYRLGANLTKNPKAFAYCVLWDDSKLISKIVEKDTISDFPEKDPLVVGSFWFRNTKDFIYAAETAILKNLTIKGEHYIANSINLLIEQGKRFVIFDIDQWISYGDPFELQIYQYWEHFFRYYHQREKIVWSEKHTGSI